MRGEARASGTTHRPGVHCRVRPQTGGAPCGTAKERRIIMSISSIPSLLSLSLSPSLSLSFPLFVISNSFPSPWMLSPLPLSLFLPPHLYLSPSRSLALVFLLPPPQVFGRLVYFTLPAACQTIDVPQSASLYRYIEKKARVSRQAPHSSPWLGRLIDG